MNRIIPFSDAETYPEVATRRLGRRGEEIAAEFLARKGFRLVAANFVVPVGRNRREAVINAEIDLIAYEGETLCFVEVKTRRSADFAAPEAAVDLRKQRQITRAARAYRRIFNLLGSGFRYDVVTVILSDENARPKVELLKNFWTEHKFSKQRWSDDNFTD